MKPNRMGRTKLASAGLAFFAMLVGCGSEAPDVETGRDDPVAATSAVPSTPAMPIGSVNVPPGGGNISVAIYRGDYQVRTLHAAQPAAGGPFSIMWDGRDDFGNTMPGGPYRFRALSSRASLVDDGSVGQAGNPSFGLPVHSSSVQVVAVDPAGNVYEGSDWEEFHQELRSWTSNGQLRWGGYVRGIGAALAADSDYVYVAQAHTDGSNRVLRFPTTQPELDPDLQPVPWSGQPVTGYIEANATGGHGVFGLAVDGNSLWVSNRTKNLIQRYEKATGAPLGEFSVSDPHGIAADGAGRIWVTHGTDAASLYDSSGSELQRIDGLQKPFSAAIGGPNGHLFIGEAASGQVEHYSLSSDPQSAPTHIRTLFGAALPGRVRDDRLRWPDTVDPQCTIGICKDGKNGPGGGFAVDATGRIIVADLGNQRVQTYSPSGAFLFRRFGSGPINWPQADVRVNPNRLLSGFFEFSVDHTPGPAHGQWALLNNWRPRGLEAFDHSIFRGALRRRLGNGHDYIYALNGRRIAVYEVAPNDLGARACAVVGVDEVGNVYSGVDSNTNGAVEPQEISWPPGLKVESNFHGPGLWVDERGHVFVESATLNGSGSRRLLLELPLDSPAFDTHANPLYDWNDVIIRAERDTTFYDFAGNNLRFEPASGEIYRLGFTTQAPLGPLFIGGTTVERRLTNGGRMLLYVDSNTSDPYFSCEPGCVAAIATDTNGDYFYAGLSGNDHTHGVGQVHVKMYTKDGLLVAASSVGALNGSESGWIDAGLGITAFTFLGRHYVYTQDGYHGRMLRWRVGNANSVARLNPIGGTPFQWNPPVPSQLVTVSATVPETSEGAGDTPAVITITRTDSRRDLAVNLQISGSATPGADFTPSLENVVIENGSFSKTIEVFGLADGTTEGDETVIVRVGPSSEYAIGTPSAATVTIHDEVTVSVAAAPATIGVDGPDAVFTLTRNDATRVLDVDYRLGPPRISVESVIASSHSDAYPEARAVDGQTSTFWGSAGNSQLPYYRDDNPEITFVFDSVRPLGMMRISNLPAGDTYNTRRGVKRVMILVSTDGSNFTEVREVEVARSAPGVQAFQQIDLEGVSARAVKFDIKSSWFTEFENGSSYEEQPYPNESIVGFAEVEFYAVGATASDVLAIPGNQVSGPFSTGTAHFDAGQSTATITVTPSGIHRVNQPPKTLELNILDTGNFVLGDPASASVDIVDNTVGPVVSLEAIAPSAERGGEPGVVRVTRSGSNASDLSVTYTTGRLPIEIASSGASSSLGAPLQSHDTRRDTMWISAGYAENQGDDNTPWISYTFDDVAVLGRLKVVNYTGPVHPCGARDVKVYLSTDAANFSLLGDFTLLRAPEDPNNAVPQYIELGAVSAKAVRIDVHTNYYNWTFYDETKPREAGYPIGSVTGLAEVQFLGGSTASAYDFAPGTLTGSVVIPAGQSAVDLQLPAVSTGTLGAELTLELTSDDTVYSIGTPASATIAITDP